MFKTTNDHTNEEWRGLAIKQGDIIVQMSTAIREMIYEATHLSPAEADGSHWCKISIVTMANAYISACVDAHLAQVEGNQGRAVECAKLADAIERVYPEAAEAARLQMELRDDRNHHRLPR